MKRIKSIIANPLFAGSAVMVVGGNLSNFFSYIFHLIIGRMLGPTNYGELLALISVFGMIISLFSFINVIITKFVSSSTDEELPGLLSWYEQNANKYGLVFCGLLLLCLPVIANFVKLDYKLLLLLPPLVFFTIKKTVYLSFLSGLLRFGNLVVTNNLEQILKIIISLILIFLGFSVFGAFAGYLMSSILGVVILRYFLRDKFVSGKRFNVIHKKRLISYSLLTLINSIAMMSFFSSDVILVKHFFSSFDVGIYGALSNMGKIIFYALAPVGAVMFPLISNRHAKGENYISIFLLSCLLVGSGVFIVLVAYKLFPVQMITLLFGEQFIIGAPSLFTFGLVMSIFSFDNLIITYYLSQEKLKPVSVVALAALFQVIGIYFYHESIHQVIQVSLYSVLLLSFGLMLYFFYEKRYEKGEKRS